MRKPNALPGLIFVIIFGIGLALDYSTLTPPDYRESVTIAVVSAIIAYIVSYAIKVADQWDRAVGASARPLSRSHGSRLVFHHSDY
jgi:hypothetical protein